MKTPLSQRRAKNNAKAYNEYFEANNPQPITPMNESMEITNEVKDKVFAQYLGQSCRTFNPLVENILNGKLMQVDLPEYLVVRNEEDLSYHSQTVNGVKLLLKPLSAISDDDCHSIQMILNVTEIPDVKYIKRLLGRYFTKGWKSDNVSGFLMTQVYQFLLSRGYDLPQYLLGGKTLHECNLCIYE